MLIINTGGTLNKIYNKITGTLEVATNNKALEELLTNFYNLQYELKGIIYKDSLDMDDDDRALLLHEINISREKKILIIHGTDTMDVTAKFLDENIKDKTIVVTGAMKPYEVDSIEANSNFSLAVGALSFLEDKGVFISMGGVVLSFSKYVKDKNLGLFS